MPFFDKETVVVFAGASDKLDSRFYELAEFTGKLLAEENFIVASGAGPGLMEAVSKGAQQAGGNVLGVGLMHKGRNEYLNKYIERLDIRSRQSSLIGLGDAFLALPGGSGTLYEIVEIATLRKLEEEPPKPIIVLNPWKYYDHLKKQLDVMREENFIQEPIGNYLSFVETPEEAIGIIKSFYNID